MATRSSRPSVGAPRVPSRRLQSRRRRRILLFLLVLVVVVVVVLAVVHPRHPSYVVLHNGSYSSVEVPIVKDLAPLRRRIVTLAEQQLGYRTDPANGYCNKFSAYWYSGATDCPAGERDEEWCADFAAWIWQKAGVPVVYQYEHGDLNSSSASFYEWGVGHGSWHPLGSGYTPRPGDVAVYGLDRATLVASHVAIVVGSWPGQRGPIAINGDGDETGFSVVEVRGDEYYADTHPSGAPLAGYVSPD